jgi:nitrogen regulatory protein PII
VEERREESFMSDMIQMATAMAPASGPASGMTKIEAIVESFRAVDVLADVSQLVTSIARSEVEWHLRDGRPGVYRGVEYTVEAVGMVKLEILVSTRLAGRVLDALERAVSSSRTGGQILSSAIIDTALVRSPSQSASVR